MSTKPGNPSGSRSNDDSPPGGDDRDQARAQDLKFEKMCDIMAQGFVPFLTQMFGQKLNLFN